MKPWTVQQSKSDADVYEVRGAYLVADDLPIEDANLIAAAPDLAVALDYICRSGALDIREHDDLIEKAKAALAKARGEINS